jgi:hypothetical protein
LLTRGVPTVVVAGPEINTNYTTLSIPIHFSIIFEK